MNELQWNSVTETKSYQYILLKYLFFSNDFVKLHTMLEEILQMLQCVVSRVKFSQMVELHALK